LENKALWQVKMNLGLLKLAPSHLLRSVSPETLDAAARCNRRLHHTARRRVERAEAGLWHILTSGCCSLQTPSFSKENF